MPFEELELAPELLHTLTSQAMTEPTSVQSATIPAVMQGQDVLVCAKTGSGKSLAYLLPLLSLKNAAVDALQGTVLILVPTRELVHQLSEVLKPLLSHWPRFKAVSLTGGASINPQLMQLRGGADLIIATPGRVLDVIRHNGVDVKSITVLVLDEADRLLDGGFAEETDEILEQISPRQRLMLSATFSKRVNARAKWLLRKPVLINLLESEPAIKQRCIQVDNERRVELLVHLLQHDLLETPALVFVSHRKSTERLVRKLGKHAVQVDALHGKLSSERRAQVLSTLAAGKLQIVTATDLAARGLDVPRLPTVVNFDLPRSTELYTHRIGRTGRAGHAGTAISLVDISAEPHMALIEKRIGVTIEREQLPGFEPVNMLERVPVLNDGNGGIKGRRMSKKDKLRAAAQRHDGLSGGSDE